MPNQQSQYVPKKESVQPTRGLLSRIFGTDPVNPQMQEGIDIARKEMPDLAPVEPYGFFSRLLSPKNAMGYVSPGNTIYLNSRMNQFQTPQEIADTLTHEQEHVKQQKSSGYSPTMQLLKRMLIPERTPYEQRPDELGAWQAERQRRRRMGRQETAVPSFSGGWMVPRDTHLPLPKKPIQQQ